MKGSYYQELPGDGQWWYEKPDGDRLRMYERTCGGCGRVQVARKQELTILCNSCSKVGRVASGDTRRKMFEAKAGVKNPSWRGGRKITGDGYVLIHKPDHPNAHRNGYVLEHRLVMEEILGRYLELKEVVHHENEIRGDNRPENLRLFANSNDHHRYHRETARDQRRVSTNERQGREKRKEVGED